MPGMTTTPRMIDLGYTVEEKGKSTALVEQVHSNRVVKYKPGTFLPKADGIWTDTTDRALYVFTADCIPFLIYGSGPTDPIAAIHCGWRSALSGVVHNARTTTDITRERTRVWVGPSIGPCCFEVREDFLTLFRNHETKSYPFTTHENGKYFFDLVGWVMASQMKDLSQAQIDKHNWRCTRCSKPSLPSYRRTGNTDPRIKSWVIRRRSG
jgi:YfiH family protein